MAAAQAAQSLAAVTLAPNALRRKLLGIALEAPEFRKALDEAARDIRNSARPTATEATIESRFEMAMYGLLRDIGLQFSPDKEVSVDRRRHLARGRTDSRLGALVIEYKRPSLLSSAAERAAAMAQLGEYLESLSLTSSTPYVGILTNGLVATEMRAVAGKIVQQSAFVPLSGALLLRLTQAVISLALTALTSVNLIRDFCGTAANGVLFQVARVLDGILVKGSRPKTAMLRREWEEMFRLAHDDLSQQKKVEDRRAALADLFSIDVDDAATEYRVLFALHTAYAILLKFIAYHVVYDIQFGKKNSQDYRSLATASSAALRLFCSALEDGDVFRELGIVNLLEGDFFSWYADRGQWDSTLADAIKELLSNLARYEEARNLFESSEVPDLFRELYQATVPRAVRSSFGEFYTPYWLAEHVLGSAALGDKWRVLDPCCGSGTFVIAAIARLRRESKLTGSALLSQILTRVAAIDLNPLGVLTTRIHYFIHVSNLIDASTENLAIPVFLGDAASIPEHVEIDGHDCLCCQLKTLKTPITATLPVSLVSNTARFMLLMREYEQCIVSQNAGAAATLLRNAVAASERSQGVDKAIELLTENLVDLERKGWNGIWARILSNFLSTACLGRFTGLVGNPPWIDWKNLPSGYRERVKAMCIDRGLFSGAGRTGGINLNICALIAYVAANNWLDEERGRLAFLMPRELANQASYEGWRRLGGRWCFLRFDDWSDAGHPFDPVKEDFMTFVIGKAPQQSDAVPVTHFRRVKGTPHPSKWKDKTEALERMEETRRVAGQVIPGSTAFTFAANEEELKDFSVVAGECSYIGRQGVEFYPQELFLFKYEAPGPRMGTAWMRNVQAPKSKYKIPSRRVLLETTYLLPLVKGAGLVPFAYEYDGLIVAFPYEPSDPLRPVPSDVLRAKAPLLLKYYNQAREIIAQQTGYSTKLRGTDPGEFYGLPRTGPYSFAKVYAAFRDNTRWGATVIRDAMMPWGRRARFVFQKHAVSMCERADGSFIGEEEAHFISAILNAPIVGRFIAASSDERSYNIRPPLFIPLFDPGDLDHKALATGSRAAHEHPEQVEEIRTEMERLYLKICRLGSRLRDLKDARVASQRLGEIGVDPSRLVSGEVLEAELDDLLS